MPIARINDHTMYYEVHGTKGDPVLLMGGWGTFCHGGEKHLPWGLTDNHRVVIIDYRGIGESDDDLSKPPSIDLYAEDGIQLLQHLGFTKNVHLIGLVGMGACISQVMAIKRPDMVKSMMNMGAWCDATDPFFHDQIDSFRAVHRDAGWATFQRLVCVMSFRPDFYNENHHRLLGPNGPWRELNGRFAAHDRFITACLAHNVTAQLKAVKAKTLIVHSHLDIVTGPRMTKPIEHAIPGAKGLDLPDFAHVVAGKEQKIQFAKLVNDWMASVQ
ncbi:MAG: alpha/beta hydrolase [Rhodospirillaceae bacterium]|nr:alpha/beta hydrolase [Rhodospirillaceae bacterium]